ncbi:MAG: TcpQ domain-containing protein [Micavibrio sp.]
MSTPMPPRLFMHPSLRLAALTGAAVLALLPVHNHAMAQSAQAHAFQPMGQWMVGPAQLPSVRGLEGMSLPCILSNDYDNGFIIRFSGGGGRMMAMAVDFRQDVFRPGHKYTALLSLGDKYAQQVTGTAFAANTLIFNLRGLEDVYKEAAQANWLGLSIADNNMYFALGRMGDSYAALEQCYHGDDAAPAMAQQDYAAQYPAQGGQGGAPYDPSRSYYEPSGAGAMPQNLDDIMRGGDAHGGDAYAQPRSLGAIPARQSPASVAQWNASAGEDIRTVLNRWADRAGYDLQWQAEQNGIVAQDVALDGRFEEAVAELLAVSGAASGLQGRVQNDASPARAAPHVPSHNNGSYDASSAAYPASNPVPSEPAAGIRRARPAGAAQTLSAPSAWTAPAGMALKDVLQDWAGREGVAVIWHADDGFQVRQGMALNGTFESAVAALLDQFSSETPRPVGGLNTDPESGLRTLTIDQDG